MKIKKIKKVLISLLLLVVMLFSTACFSDFDPQGNNFANLEGIKANYRPSYYNYYDFYYDFSKTTLDRLYQTFFYNPDNNDLKQIYNQINNLEGEVDTTTDQWKQFAVYFYSDVNYSTNILKNEQGQNIAPDLTVSQQPFYFDQAIAWNWKADLNDLHYFNNNDATSDIDNIINFYKTNEAEQNQNYIELLDTNAKCLQVAVLQIILGKTPTIFNQQNMSSAQTLLGQASLQDEKVQATGLMGELVTNGTYVGINDTALSQIKDYILQNVIGTQKFYENNQKNNFSIDDYKLVLETIWQDTQAFQFKSIFEGKQLTGCVFDEYPAINIKDYESNSFFINSNDDIAFNHIEKANYQSIVLMPSQTEYLNEIWFFLASDTKFKVNYYTRYYDYETNTLYESEIKQVETNIENQFVSEKAQMGEVNFKKDNKSTIIKLQDFNNEINNSILKAEQEITMNYERSNYYLAQPSVNGFGTVSVLNPHAFSGAGGCSFLEIVFDVEKPLNSVENYDFKVGFFYYGLASRDDINDFNK